MDAFPALSFDRPVALFQVPEGAPGAGDRRVFVAEQGGRILALGEGATASSVSVLLDLSPRTLSVSSFDGLLSAALHPGWGESFLLAVSYTPYPARAGSLVTALSLFASFDSGATLDPASERRLLTVTHPWADHPAGATAFGPEGALYWGVGDGGSVGDPLEHAQDTRSLLGKVLRIDVRPAPAGTAPAASADATAGLPYSAPAGNPFAGSPAGGRAELFAWGFRDPRSLSFDRFTGELWVADRGQNSWEEVDRVAGGGNYGWNIREGEHCFRDVPCDRPDLVGPAAEYSREEGCAVTGGFVYRGGVFPALAGSYLFGDLCSGRIWALRPGKKGKLERRLLADTPLSIAALAEGRGGTPFLIDRAGGRIYRLVPAGTAAAQGAPGGAPGGN